MKQKLLSLLVLLMTATTGVWAEESETIATTNKIVEGTHFTISNHGSYADTDGMIAVSGITVTAKNGETITKVVISCTDPNNVNDGTTSVSSGTKEITNGGGTITVTGVNASTFTFTCSHGGPQFSQFVVYYTDVLVTTNAASVGAPFTEASFTMPANDVIAEYELVRDMSVYMTARLGDGTVETPRFRVQQNAQSQWEPVGFTAAQIPALFTVIDTLDAQNPDTLTQTTDYTVQIFALGDNNQPTGTAMTFADFTFAPGRYVVKAVAVEGSDYGGETAFSNVFQLYFGYPLEIAAGEFATFYKDEVLTTEDEDAALYTITSVSDNTVVLSSAISVAPASTPLIVYNGGSEKKTIVLLPSEDTPDEVNNVSSMFVGTLEASTIAASTATQTNYALNGREFVVVRSNLSVAANKCWLEVPAAQEAARLNIVFGDVATGISQIENGKLTIENSVYDLQGRRVESSIFNSQSSMLKKGVYIINGKKVVVK